MCPNSFDKNFAHIYTQNVLKVHINKNTKEKE